jgi:thioredoxin 1
MGEIEEIKKRKIEELMKKMNYPNKTVEITDGNFTETIQKYSLVVVDCWADWCGPCRMIAPTLEQMAKDLSGKLVFGKLNVDHNREIPAKFNIMSIPTLLIFKNGKLVDTVTGALPREMIEAKLQPHMN